MAVFQSHVAFPYLLRLYQLLGFCPISIPDHQNAGGRYTLYAAIFVVHFVIATVQLCLVLGFYKPLFKPRDAFGRINDSMKFCAVSFAYYAICVESFVQRQRHAAFWRRSLRLRTAEGVTSQSRSQAPRYERECTQHARKYLLHVGAFHVMYAVFWAILLPVVVQNEFSLSFYALYSWMVVLSRLRHWQFVQYIDRIETELQWIAERLEDIANYSAHVCDSVHGQPNGMAMIALPECPLTGDECWDRFVWQRLHWAQRRYGTLYEMADDVNAAFGWSQLANCLQAFVQLLSDMYWVYWRFYDNKTYPLIRAFVMQCIA